MKKHWSLVGLEIGGISAEKVEEKELVQEIKMKARMGGKAETRSRAGCFQKAGLTQPPFTREPFSPGS